MHLSMNTIMQNKMIKLGIKCDIEDRSQQTYMLYKSGLLIRCNKKNRNYAKFLGHIMQMSYMYYTINYCAVFSSAFSSIFTTFYRNKNSLGLLQRQIEHQGTKTKHLCINCDKKDSRCLSVIDFRPQRL